jgi:hypothetical protein
VAYPRTFQVVLEVGCFVTRGTQKIRSFGGCILKNRFVSFPY